MTDLEKFYKLAFDLTNSYKEITRTLDGGRFLVFDCLAKELTVYDQDKRILATATETDPCEIDTISNYYD